MELMVKVNNKVVANYMVANLTHSVTTIVSPDGIATVSGAGTYTNGQTVRFSAPASVTNGASIYTLVSINVNGSSVSQTSSYTRTFATTDPTALVVAAIYSGQLLQPQVLR